MSQQIAGFRRDTDAFGHEIYAYWKDKDGIEIIERDDGFIEANDTVTLYFTDYADWSDFEKEGMEYLAPGRSLDLGCGAGRVELYLQSQGCQVTGIDNSPLAIQVCKERGVIDARLLPVEKITPDLGTFSNIIMYGNNWGLMGNPRKAKRLLRLFHRMTTPDARILAMSNNIYKTTSPEHLAYHAYNRERGRMAGQIRMRVRHKVCRSKWFDYLMVSKPEMEEILTGTGWQVLKYLDSPGSTYLAILEKMS